MPNRKIKYKSKHEKIIHFQFFGAILIISFLPFNQIAFYSTLVFISVSKVLFKRVVVIDKIERTCRFLTSIIEIKFGSSHSFSEFDSIVVKQKNTHDVQEISNSDFDTKKYIYTISIRLIDGNDVLLTNFTDETEVLNEVEKLSKATSKKILNTTTYVNLVIQKEIENTPNVEFRGIIESKLSYFRHLSELGKDEFIERVHKFIFEKRFIYRNGIEANKIAVILIASSAVQLTFGLKYFTVNSLNNVLIYPDSFFIQNGRIKLNGGVFPAGAIAFSYKHFLKGYENDSDKINLGLHEMAHALKIDLLKENYNSRFEEYYEIFADKGKSEYTQMRNGEESFLRNYACTNMHEFFAVCVEHFFEAPLQFKRELPEIYEDMCILLNQNPLNTTADYSLN